MNINEIRQALDEGKTVYWQNKSYEVREHRDDLLVRYRPTGARNYLTQEQDPSLMVDGYKEEDFFIEETV